MKLIIKTCADCPFAHPTVSTPGHECKLAATQGKTVKTPLGTLAADCPIKNGSVTIEVKA